MMKDLVAVSQGLYLKLFSEGPIRDVPADRELIGNAVRNLYRCSRWD